MASVAQALPCQDGAAQTSGEVGWISLKDERFRERFQKTLLNEPTRDLEAGWQLAWELGRPAVPLLWDMLAKEKAMVERRLIVLAAAVLAGGPIEDERLFAWLEQPKPMLEERVLGCMLMALGPKRQRPVQGFWSRCSGPAKRPEQILAIALRLASARFPGAEEDAALLQDDDPGLAGAQSYACLPVSGPVATKLWNLKTPERHAELFWRGALLGGARSVSDGTTPQEGLVEKSRRVMELGSDQGTGARLAAALFRARAGDFRTDAELDGSLLQLAAADPAKARLLQERLGPTPPPRLDEPQRLAVCYVMSRDPEVVIKDRAVWGAEERIRKHVATALAMRLLADQQPRTLDSLPAVPEWVIVRWAAGAPMEAVVLDDPPLQAAVELAAAGRLSRPVMRNLLEEALWRWGSHPGLGTWENERLLLRDLILVGSSSGGGKYQPQVRPHERYRPQGLGPDDPFFTVAVALYDFTSRPRLPLPAEYRLR